MCPQVGREEAGGGVLVVTFFISVRLSDLKGAGAGTAWGGERAAKAAGGWLCISPSWSFTWGLSLWSLHLGWFELCLPGWLQSHQILTWMTRDSKASVPREPGGNDVAF